MRAAEVTNDEAPSARLEPVEPEGDEFEISLSSSLDLMPFIGMTVVPPVCEAEMDGAVHTHCYHGKRRPEVVPSPGDIPLTSL
ncbi:hypothetical protein KOW79_016002 [Hemibagrus wyckioides]|uniref:Uncharacterized protein n=1 Tax=Hemibagrus wyckioides TaxID=337641 RepID=A0A9D3SIC1_9TELE|nr:hypothetical protein KOW79_016002 [Hemibagrus wyckioides]